ncbi:Cupredoxin [Hypoxylon trugodes]|uniref:Cupredoxin n=1 Tax=Hypoxylon trugodes TaxID=326681 RepID=UPI002196304D|nr:Cupredoxin [Hypoxylon trugodes]KAI1383137.1 Cupredoxin [Hypoxylon trugodes]
MIPNESSLDLIWTSKARASLSDLPLSIQDERPRRTIPLRAFVTSLLCLFVLALTLGVGLELGFPWYKTIFAAPSGDDSGDYSAFEDLEFVPIDKLINKDELDLNTDFATSNTQGQIREYTFNITQALAAPDGFRKPMVLVNGQSPRPLIEANIGDTIRVHVNNFMANSSTAIHWHGINQQGTPWMDGVAGVSQCGIPPGESFTYEFHARDQRGTFWWHAHRGVQYSDGAYGAIVIRDPDEMVPKIDDEKLIFVADVYHTYGSTILKSYLKPTSKWAPTESGVEPLPDNILLNGQNTYDCSVTSTTFPPPSNSPSSSPPCTDGQLSTTQIRHKQTIRLRLINTSSFLSYWFSIDNHTLTIVELDGVEIEPIVGARGVYLNLGQTSFRYHNRGSDTGTVLHACFGAADVFFALCYV